MLSLKTSSHVKDRFVSIKPMIFRLHLSRLKLRVNHKSESCKNALEKCCRILNSRGHLMTRQPNPPS